MQRAFQLLQLRALGEPFNFEKEFRFWNFGHCPTNSRLLHLRVFVPVASKNSPNSRHRATVLSKLGTNFRHFLDVHVSACWYISYKLGFGLIFSYNKRLVFSGIGFTLLITILSVEWYFLFNAFWTKANFYNEGTDFNYDRRFVHIYLTNRDDATNLVERYRATLTDAVRCGLANSVAFSAILGRAGLVEAFVVSLIGTIGY